MNAMRFYVVGSALNKKYPRDIDLFGVMDDRHFEATYGLAPEEFGVLHELDEETVDQDMMKWRYECLGAVRVLQFVFPELVPIDFKFIPRSLLREPNREVDMTLPTFTWRIGFPDLAEHHD